MTSIDHLHEEIEVSPFHDHLSLLCLRYLAITLQSNNSSHNVITSSSGFRNVKHTLHSRFLHRVVPCLSNDILPTTSFRFTFHGEIVSQLISSLVPNRVLQTSSAWNEGRRSKPPLPSYTTALSQLRSPYFSFLHSYRKRMDWLPVPSALLMGRNPTPPSIFYPVSRILYPVTTTAVIYPLLKKIASK